MWSKVAWDKPGEADVVVAVFVGFVVQSVVVAGLAAEVVAESVYHLSSFPEQVGTAVTS